MLAAVTRPYGRVGGGGSDGCGSNEVLSSRLWRRRSRSRRRQRVAGRQGAMEAVPAVVAIVVVVTVTMGC